MAEGNNIIKMSPRQRMINLMYIVLTAMLALNVSSDVLNGFNQVHDGLQRTYINISAKNEAQYQRLESLFTQNPQKTGTWYEKGLKLQEATLGLLNSIDSLKSNIARQADGKHGDPSRLINLDDLDAASVVLLNPNSSQGEKLKKGIDNFRVLLSDIITDSVKLNTLSEILSTDIQRSDLQEFSKISWEEKMFDNMPAIAALTQLSKLQNDIRQAEGEALSSLITSIDIGDVRVNELNPYVIPNSNMVMRGGVYTANIVMAAIDTTQKPVIYINGTKLKNDKGIVELPATTTGSHEYSGYIEMTRGDGMTERRPFSTTFTVMEPMATISSLLMNVLYAGIDNPISISVPGVPMKDIQAHMNNGDLTRKGDIWIARPHNIGSDAEITVSALIDNKIQQVGKMNFRVRKLPDPSPFIPIKDNQGNDIRYTGSPKRISKAALMAAENLGAALNDNILDVNYTVISFSTVFFDNMNNAIPEVSDGNKFSDRQKEQFRRLKPGKSFFISNVKAKGPDGVIRDITPLEVTLN